MGAFCFLCLQVDPSTGEKTVTMVEKGGYFGGKWTLLQKMLFKFLI
jgi:hypothetical protein